jgi:hypothetical protein
MMMSRGRFFVEVVGGGFRNKKIKNCWTHDGKILVKSLAEKIVQITDEKDLEQFLKITVVQDPTTSYGKEFT